MLTISKSLKPPRGKLYVAHCVLNILMPRGRQCVEQGYNKYIFIQYHSPNGGFFRAVSEDYDYDHAQLQCPATKLLDTI